MLAVVDIGNTRVKVAAFPVRDEPVVFSGLHSVIAQLADRLFADFPIQHLLISSTADIGLDTSTFHREGVSVFVLSSQTDLPIRLDYSQRSLGADRVADAVAGFSLDPEACLVIDLGTCITYNHVVEGIFIGGAISPGWSMRLKAMAHFTGRLPLVEQAVVEGVPDHTQAALQCGAAQGIKYEIQGFIAAFRSLHPDATCLLTGGDALVFEPLIENHIFADPFHTLKGLHDILHYQLH